MSSKSKLQRVSVQMSRKITDVSWIKMTVGFLLMIFLSFILFPILYTFSVALRASNNIGSREISLLPSPATLEQFTTLFSSTNFPIYLQQSVVITIGVIVLTTALATLGGYGLTRLDIPFKKTFARGILIGYMFPPILLAIPMYIIWSEIGIINSTFGVILAETAISLPFSLWIMWQFFQTVPESLEECAMVQGASRFRTFYEISLPMALPGVISVAVFSFAVAWSEYTMPKILLVNRQLWPITVGIDAFTQDYAVNWGHVMAASAVAILPAFLFVYGLQKYLLQGFRTRGLN